MGIEDRLRRLEARRGAAHAACILRDGETLDDYIEALEGRGWPADEQCDQVVDTYRVHRAGGTALRATDRQLVILEALIGAGKLPEGARDCFYRMPPAEQPEREAWLFRKREWCKADREAQREWDEWAKENGSRYPIPDHIQAKFVALEGGHRRRV